MKRFILVVSALALLAIAVIYAVYFRGLYLDVDPNAPVTAVFRTEGKQLLRQTGTGEWESFVIRGVDVSVSYTHLDVYKRQNHYSGRRRRR